jgi:hypothetical protein
MVALVEMAQEELDEYLEHAIQGLADELMQANAWSAEQSLAAAVQSFDTALPGRVVGSANQLLRTIIADGQKVGVLWVRAPRQARGVHVGSRPLPRMAKSRLRKIGNVCNGAGTANHAGHSNHFERLRSQLRGYSLVLDYGVPGTGPKNGQGADLAGFINSGRNQ